MTTQFAGGPGGGEPAAATEGEVAPVVCLFEHAAAGIALVLGLGVVMTLFVAAALESYALGALVGVLVLGVAGMAVVLVPLDRRGR